MQARISVFLLSSFLTLASFAQCPMCKAVAESAQREGSKHAAGLNNGILYLLVLPYLSIMIIGYLWYRAMKKRKQREQQLSAQQ